MDFNSFDFVKVVSNYRHRFEAYVRNNEGTEKMYNIEVMTTSETAGEMEWHGAMHEARTLFDEGWCLKQIRYCWSEQIKRI